MNLTQLNPFAGTDAERAAIWEMLVAKDTAAFLAIDWSMTAGDFVEEGFTGISGSSDPDHWRISYPDLSSYRDEWLRQADLFRAVELRGESKAEFVYRCTVLRDIEITGDRAAAHKKFDGRDETVDGKPVALNWQSIYWLRRTGGQWRITGFLGYLPNPMPRYDPPEPAIHAPKLNADHGGDGPYSPVVRATGGTWIATSGQGPIGSDGRIRGTTIEEQAAAAFENCRNCLASAGASFRDVFKTTVYLQDIGDWAAFNEVYCRHFAPPYPARTAIQAVLRGGTRVEIEMLAIAR